MDVDVFMTLRNLKGQLARHSGGIVIDRRCAEGIVRRYEELGKAQGKESARILHEHDLMLGMFAPWVGRSCRVYLKNDKWEWVQGTLKEVTENAVHFEDYRSLPREHVCAVGPAK